MTVRFEGDDLALLEQLIEVERLTRSDVIRRAIRAYAAALRVGSPPPRKPKRK